MKFCLYLKFRSGDDCYLEEVVGQSFEILWELYWKQPHILEQMLSNLMTPIPEHEQYEQMYQNSALREPRIRDVIDIFHVFELSRADRLGSDSMLLEKLAVDMQTLRGFDTSHAARRIHEFRESYGSGARDLFDQNFRQTRYYSPSWRSIGEQLLHYKEGCLRTIDDEIRKFLNSPIDGEEAPANPLNTSQLSDGLQNNVPANSVVLFAPSGAGKTYEILQYLSRNFGFYFQACMLPISRGDFSIHGPHRQAGSKDTYSLRQLLDYANDHAEFQYEGDTSTVFEFQQAWLDLLVRCRFLIFSRFLSIANDMGLQIPGNRLQRLWLLLQTSDERDIFDRFFQICSICIFFPGNDIDSMIMLCKVRETLANLGFSGPLCYCLDEAQADLDFTITEGPEIWSYLNVWATTFMKLFRHRHLGPLYLDRPGSQWPGSDISIFAGTSLKLKEAVSTIQQVRYYHPLLQPNSWVPCELYHLRQVATVADFRAIMEQSKIAATLSQQYSTKKGIIKAKIVECAKMLFGRPRWSDLFLCNLNQEFSSPGTDDWESTIEDIAEKTCENVRRDLTERLRVLNARDNSRKYIELMDNLCRVAINQEILDSGYFFMDDEHHILISEGFAYMKPVDGKFQQVISETLAVQAAKEYFILQNSKLVEKELDGMIEAGQDDQGALGRTAEWFLAWVSDEGYVAAVTRIDWDFRICTGHLKTIETAFLAL